ncbi:MAG: isochorismatase family cysteine hydrolase [Bacillota bacterium]|nr:isochorismatase family cysteine hydrolase [Bacillota bacterium]
MSTALVVIDMLEDFLSPSGNLYIGPEAGRVIPAVAVELERARAEGWPVIFVCDSHREGDPEFAMWPDHCLCGSQGAAVIPALAPRPGEPVIAKRRYSAFFGTDLDLTLRERGVEEVVLVGVCTNICVLYTAADARMLNYSVTVVAPATASFDRAAHDFALQQMETVLGCQVRR